MKKKSYIILLQILNLILKNREVNKEQKEDEKNIIIRILIKSGVQNIIKFEEEFYIEYNVNFTINTFFPEKHNFKKTKKGLVKFLETSI